MTTIVQFVLKACKRPQKQRRLLGLNPIIWRVLAMLIFSILLLVIFAPGNAQAKGAQAHAQAAQTTSSASTTPKKAATTKDTCIAGPSISVDTYVQDPGVDAMHNLRDPLGNGSILFYYTPLNATVDALAGKCPNPIFPVRIIWGVCLGLVDVFVALSLALSAIRIMLAGTVFRYANAVEELPGTLLALIAAHLSLVFVIVILGLNNAMSVGLVNWADTGILFTRSNYQSCDNGVLNTGIAPKCYDDATQDVYNSIVPTDLNLPSMSDALSSITNLTGLIVKVLGLMLLAQVIIRLFLVNFYIVIAPLGIACWALPGKTGQPLTRLWFQGFISTVMVQFLQVLAVIVSEVMLGAILDAVYGQGLPSSQQGSTVVHTLANILAIAVLWFLLRIPSLLGAASLRMLGEAGHAMSQAAGGAVVASATQIKGVAMVVQGAGALAA